MRVLQVVTDPSRRGAQLFAVDLAAALVAAGLDVRTVALGPAPGGSTLDLRVLGRRRIARCSYPFHEDCN